MIFCKIQLFQNRTYLFRCFQTGGIYLDVFRQEENIQMNLDIFQTLFRHYLDIIQTLFRQNLDRIQTEFRSIRQNQTLFRQNQTLFRHNLDRIRHYLDIIQTEFRHNLDRIQINQTEFRQNLDRIQTEFRQNLDRIQTELDRIQTEFRQNLDKIRQNLDRIQTEFRQNLNKIKAKFRQNLDRIQTEFRQNLDRIQTEFRQNLDIIQNRWNHEPPLGRLQFSGHFIIKAYLKTIKVEEKTSINRFISILIQDCTILGQHALGELGLFSSDFHRPPTLPAPKLTHNSFNIFLKLDPFPASVFRDFSLLAPAAKSHSRGTRGV